jgi:ABC-type sugar transport system permease subunit
MKGNDLRSYSLMYVPGLLIYVCFMLIPIILCFYYAFFDWNGINSKMNFVGFDNFVKGLSDKQFHRALYVTLFITVISTIIVNAFGILFAVLLNKKGKLTNFYRSVFFFPLLLSPVAVGFIWKSIINYNGLLNMVLQRMNIEKIQFLGDPQWSVLTIAGIAIWQSTGFIIVIYLAGLQTIPKELYDAASIDGASRLSQFNNITFPLLAPSFTMGIVFMFTGMMREYDRIAVLTQGGPAGSTETIAYQIVREGFSANRLSYASSLSVYLLIIVGVLATTMTVYLRRREERIV